jgi:NADH:ubiquinone oxidoreductase subunit 6 (subunit J)
MSVMDKIVLYVAGTMDLGFAVGYLLSGQPVKSLYWFGATVIVVAAALMR